MFVVVVVLRSVETPHRSHRPHWAKSHHIEETDAGLRGLYIREISLK